MNFAKCFIVSLLLCFWGQEIFSQKLRVASYNLRYDNPADSLDNWKYRKEVVGGLIKFHDFDIFGSQEGLHHQLEDLLKELPDYSFIGVGRDDGKENGEYAAIFYKTAMFELLDKGNFWLSQDPSYPNKGWDAVLPRICSWGKFREKSTGFIFYFYNVHFDHVGKLARRESAQLILQRIEKRAGDVPTILTGDFNVDQDSDSYKVLNSSAKLIDAHDKALFKYGAEGTFNGFNIDTRSKSRIDHIFISNNFKVLKYGILTDTYQTAEKNLRELANTGAYPKEIILYQNQARLPSDHYPVLTILENQDESTSYGSSEKIERFNKDGYTLNFINEDPNLNPEIKTGLINTFFIVYPKMVKAFNLQAPELVRIKIDTSYTGVAYANDAMITVSSKWLEKKPNDLDVITHEAMHIVQAYPNNSGPEWLTEGIADFVRFKYGVNNARADWSLPEFSMNQQYSNSYRITARFLYWLSIRYDRDIVKKFDKKLRDNYYFSNLWEDFTGKSLNELWNEYSKNPKLF